MKATKRNIITTVAAAAVTLMAVTAILPAVAAGYVPAADRPALAPAAPAVKFAAAPVVPVATTAVKATTAVEAADEAQPMATYTGKKATAGKKVNEAAQARKILRSLIAKHPILAGTTVTIGKTPGGYQAVAYYTSGRIIINPKHRASLTRILNHEVWHVIDWRDNGQIDWGENVPPRS